MTIETFIEKCKKIHGNKYNYSLVPNVIKTRDKIKIECNIHGVFEQKVNAHLRGQNCKKCVSQKFKNTKTNFIKKSNLLHNNKYDYSLVDYKNVEKSQKIHNERYDYSLVDYKNSKIKVKIICPKHGIFEQIPYSHLKGMGCCFCKMSKGEIQIKNYLENKNISFELQKRFDDCINIKTLPFDFYLPNYLLCIEFDGKQHFELIDYFGGEKGLIYRKKNDQIKTDYCKENNINLLRISYKEDIYEKLKNIK